MPDTAKTLSAAQVLVLTTAARRPARMALPLPAGLRARGAARRALLASLLERGLVEERPTDDQALSWRRDGRGRHQALRITAAGLAAAGGAGGSDRPAAAQAPDAADGPAPAPGRAGAPGANHRASFSGTEDAAPTDADATNRHRPRNPRRRRRRRLLALEASWGRSWTRWRPRTGRRSPSWRRSPAGSPTPRAPP